MTPNPPLDDSLRQVWISGAQSPPNLDTQALLASIEVKARKFDRRIRTRNLVEILAGTPMVFVFAHAAALSRDPLEVAGNRIIAASLIWIVFYFLFFGRDRSNPDPSQPVEVYRNALARKFDYQIRLFRNVKYWYLFPPYVGFVVLLIARLRLHRGWDWDAIAVQAIVTAVFAGIWYGNEVLAVRAMKKARDKLTQRSGETE